jgi:hypothetical protein
MSAPARVSFFGFLPILDRKSAIGNWLAYESFGFKPLDTSIPLLVVYAGMSLEIRRGEDG